MTSLSTLLAQGRTPRVIGFDDAPFDKHTDTSVCISGVVCAGTRFEGMVWGSVTRDGSDATDVIASLLLRSKFHAQVHVVLLDGIAVAGMNVVDLPALAAQVERPCIAVMRRLPDLAAMEAVARRLPDVEERLARLHAAGPIYTTHGTPFQVAGESPDIVPAVLAVLTDRGKVPEPLRLAHLIGSAIKTGESGRRA